MYSGPSLAGPVVLDELQKVQGLGLFLKWGFLEVVMDEKEGKCLPVVKPPHKGKRQPQTDKRQHIRYLSVAVAKYHNQCNL